MPAKEEEEFELVLGNKQLLSLFFVVVVFFAAFFSVGYTVGYGHGESSRSAPTAQAETAEPEASDEVLLPDALLKKAPEPEPPPKATAVAARAAAKPAPAPKRERPKAPAPKPAPKPAVEGSGYHLQVAALRVDKDAKLLAAKLEGKGYPAAVDSARGDGWFRVIVGPFSSKEAAQGYRAKLRSDGFDTILRKR